MFVHIDFHLTFSCANHYAFDKNGRKVDSGKKIINRIYTLIYKKILPRFQNSRAQSKTVVRRGTKSWLKNRKAKKQIQS